MPTIEFRNVSKSFGDHLVLVDFSLKIAAGECLALVGSSGCGKTTVLRLLAGLERPDKGQIVIGAQVVSTPKWCLPPYQRRLAMMFQDLALWPHLRAWQHIDFVLKTKGGVKLKKTERRAKALEVLKLAKIEHGAEALPSQLSGGEKQRLALGRAIASEPQILLLDEPMANLDFELKAQLCDEIAQLRRRFEMTIVYATHDRWEATTISDRMVKIGNFTPSSGHSGQRCNGRNV